MTPEEKFFKGVAIVFTIMAILWSVLMIFPDLLTFESDRSASPCEFVTQDEFSKQMDEWAAKHTWKDIAEKREFVKKYCLTGAR